MSEKHPETLETQHRRAAMTYQAGRQLRWRRLAGWCVPARPRHAHHRPREKRRCRTWGGRDRSGLGRVSGLIEPAGHTTTKFINSDLSKWPSEAGSIFNRLG
jgi:hypothetical protein